METTPLEIGAIAFIFLTATVLFIKGFWDYLKTRESKKKENGNGDLSQKILTALESQNTNHLHHIQEGMQIGFSQMIQCGQENNKELVEAIHNMHVDLLKELQNLRR